jgi:hypothetical protein
MAGSFFDLAPIFKNSVGNEDTLIEWISKGLDKLSTNVAAGFERSILNYLTVENLDYLIRKDPKNQNMLPFFSLSFIDTFEKDFCVKDKSGWLLKGTDIKLDNFKSFCSDSVRS